ncbi:ATP-binding protein [Candidatus Poriferisocius sp.]|uniref:ATP-binding protein n=1 Tax=Candidatus Poriferisocius sp. TaxID=3101276 RepID=UPI003B0157CF
MEALRNPYSPGAGTPPPALVGRDTEIANFEVAVERLALGRADRSQMLIGLRGVGKTVLLREFSNTAARRGWVCQHLECVEDTNLAQAAANLSRTAILDLSAGKRMAEWGSRALGVLKSFQLAWEIPSGGSVTLGFDPDPMPGRADSGDFGRDLTDLFRAVSQLAKERETGVLLAIDEIQHLHAERLTPLLVALHEISQLQLPLVVAGAGLPSLFGLLGEARSYAERLFAFSSIDRLNRESAIEALEAPALGEGVEWEDAALHELVEATAGYPYFLQEFGKQAWRVAPGPARITRADVLTAVPLAMEELDKGFFNVRIDRATKAERDYLVAMSSLGADRCRSSDVAKRLGRTTRQVSPIRDSLIKRGLCFAPAHDVIAFTVPMFDEFLKRRF